MANGNPHVHEVTITELGTYWCVRYGDQVAFPDKPRLRWRWQQRAEGRLRRTIERLIRKHDDASREVAAAPQPWGHVVPQLRSGAWGDEQLGG